MFDRAAVLASIAVVLCGLTPEGRQAVAADDPYFLISYSGGGSAGGNSWGKYSTATGQYLGNLIAPDSIRFSLPDSSALGRDRLLYLTDTLNDSVYRYDLNGQYVDTFLSGLNGLDNIRGIAAYGNEILVSNMPINDRANSSIRRYSLDGQYLGEINKGNNSFAVTTTRDRRVIAAQGDGLNTSADVTIFGFDGSILATPYTSTRQPTQIAEASDGRFVGIDFDGKVTLFDQNGLIRSVSVPLSGSQARGIQILDDGNWLVTTFSTGVFVYDSQTGSRLRTVRSGYGFGTVTLVPAPATAISLACLGLVSTHRRRRA